MPVPGPQNAFLRVAVYEGAVVFGMLAVLLVQPWLSPLPYSYVLLPAAGLVALWASRFVYPDDPARGYQLGLANGVAALVLLRPWVDGITFPQFNVHFLLGAIGLFVLWGGRVAFVGEPIRFGKPVLIALGFLLVALLTGARTFQADATYRGLMIWTGYVLLFIVVSSGVRTRLAVGLVLGAFICVFLSEAAYAILHLKYRMPELRAHLQAHPEMAGLHMGQPGMSQELFFRINTNRAFGTFLFPNALAAFLILGIPLCLGGVVSCVSALRERLPAPPPRRKRPAVDATPSGNALLQDLDEPASVAVCAWVISLMVCLGAYSVYFFRFLHGEQPWTAHALEWVLCAGVVPIGVAIASYAIDRRYGFRIYWLIVQVAVFLIALTCGSFALFLTFSRGGMLGLFGALVAVAALLFWGRRKWKRGRIGSVKAVASVVLVLAAILLAAQTGNTAGTDGPVEQQGPKAHQALQEQGFWLTTKDLLRTATLEHRLGYWRVGLRMVKDHPATGVGLGNFSTAYPMYQILGTGDVKQAHNDYLQVLCETGVLGGALFAAFWAYFVLWGARRILREERPAARWMLAGLFAGVLAFLLHSVVDFNFYNPGLATFGFLLAGLFYSLATCDETAPRPPSRSGIRHQLLVAPLLFIAVVPAAASFRVYQVDRLVADWMAARARLEAADFFVKTCSPRAPAPDQPPQCPYGAVKAFLPSRHIVETFGKLFVPRDDNPNLLRPVADDEPLQGYEWVAVSDRTKAYNTAKDAIRWWVDKSIEADEQYPYSPGLAVQLFHWHDVQLMDETDPKERDRLTRECLSWAEEAVRRSPKQAILRDICGKAYWLRARFEKNVDVYKKGLEQFRLSAELYPTSHENWKNYGQKLEQFGEELKRAGDPAQGDKYIQEGRNAQRHAETLPPRAS